MDFGACNRFANFFESTVRRRQGGGKKAARRRPAARRHWPRPGRLAGAIEDNLLIYFRYLINLRQRCPAIGLSGTLLFGDPVDPAGTLPLPAHPSAGNSDEQTL